MGFGSLKLILDMFEVELAMICVEYELIVMLVYYVRIKKQVEMKLKIRYFLS